MTQKPEMSLPLCISLPMLADDLRYVYEGADGFAILPTYAIVAAHPALALVPLDSYLPGGFDRVRTQCR